VAQCLNHYATACPHASNVNTINCIVHYRPAFSSEKAPPHKKLATVREKRIIWSWARYGNQKPRWTGYNFNFNHFSQSVLNLQLVSLHSHCNGGTGDSFELQRKGNVLRWKPVPNNGSEDVVVDTNGCVKCYHALYAINPITNLFIARLQSTVTLYM
jgi:hypothetical protein